MSAEKMYHYVWHTFADKIIEASKTKIAGLDIAVKASCQYTLFYILTTCLKLLHPFMPFVTEAIWEQLPITHKKLLMIEKWPEA
jgi:valyl-tRNA synthetase